MVIFLWSYLPKISNQINTAAVYTSSADRTFVNVQLAELTTPTDLAFTAVCHFEKCGEKNRTKNAFPLFTYLYVK